VDAVGAHAVEEFGGRVAAADEVVDQPHLDAPPRGRDQRVREPPPDGVVAENVHFERDADARRLDRRQPGGEGLDPAAQQLDRVAAHQLVRILDVTRARVRRRAGRSEFVSDFRIRGGFGRRRHC
jgi:hypothetical protein